MHRAGGSVAVLSRRHGEGLQRDDSGMARQQIRARKVEDAAVASLKMTTGRSWLAACRASRGAMVGPWSWRRESRGRGKVVRAEEQEADEVPYGRLRGSIGDERVTARTSRTRPGMGFLPSEERAERRIAERRKGREESKGDGARHGPTRCGRRRRGARLRVGGAPAVVCWKRVGVDPHGG